MKKKLKAVALMSDGDHNWEVTIYDAYDNMIDAERGARRFARKYDGSKESNYVSCLHVQVLDA